MRSSRSSAKKAKNNRPHHFSIIVSPGRHTTHLLHKQPPAGLHILSHQLDTHLVPTHLLAIYHSSSVLCPRCRLQHPSWTGHAGQVIRLSRNGMDLIWGISSTVLTSCVSIGSLGRSWGDSARRHVICLAVETTSEASANKLVLVLVGL